MMHPNTIPVILLSERIYRALLILYPADYRHEYGWLMVQIFRDMCRDVYRQQGTAGIALWWCSTLLDLVLTAFEQRRKTRFVMSKANFIRFSGILLVLGGALNALAAFSQLQPDNHYTYYGVNQVLMYLFAPGSLFVGLGCIGLGLRYEQTLGRLGQWTLYLTGIGSLVMTVGIVATSIQDSLWDIWFIGDVLHVIALTAFGLLHLQKPTLPIFRALPLQMAAGWLVLWSGVFIRFFPQTTANLLSFLMYFGMGLAWLAIGLAVQRQQRELALA